MVVALGGHTHRTTIGTRGGQELLPLSAEHRTAAGVAAGDEVGVDLEPDSAPRDVGVPADLAGALAADPRAGTVLAGLTASQRTEWVRWVSEAKREATRTRRIATAAEASGAGRGSR